MQFLSSNALKRAQYSRWIQDIAFTEGPDLQEISCYPEAVGIYKSLMAGANTLIDDTSLYIFSRPDLKPEEIRWNEEELFFDTSLAFTPVRAEVWLVENNGTHITTYCGSTSGVWLTPEVIPEDCKDFDIGLIPDHQQSAGKTLYEFLKENTQYGDSFSPRFRACSAYNLGDYSTRIAIKDIKPWTGAWQK